MNEFLTGAALATMILEKTDFLPNVVNPASKEIGNAIGNIFKTVFTPFALMNEKAEIYKQGQIQEYIKEINVKLEQIPEDRLTQPRISIIGSALENSKHCLNEDDLRKMFINQIASAVDIEKQSYVRQSFAEIIKQLEPIDADNLKYFSQFCSEKSNKEIISLPVEFPCVNYIAKNSNTTLIIVPNVFLSEDTDKDYELQSSSITNLIRLGLITCTYNSLFVDDSKYEIYRKVPVYIALNQSASDELAFEIQKGTLTITPLGRDFIKTCV